MRVRKRENVLINAIAMMTGDVFMRRLLCSRGKAIAIAAGLNYSFSPLT